jgi:hypothetical protein
VKQTVISRYADTDFGALELIETQTRAKLNDGQWKTVTLREWSGKHGELGVPISVTSTTDPPIVADEIRAAFRDVVANISGFRQLIARSQLELATEWVTQGKLNLSLDEDTFSDLLTISAFSVGESRLTVFLEEAANIFAGHLLEARIELGKDIEICLAG